MKSYLKPVFNVEHFTANEYVAACGDSGVVYKFKCDAGNGVYGSVYQETNKKPGLQTGRGGDTLLVDYSQGWFGSERGFYACDKTHEAESDNEFVNGYYCAKGNTSNPVDVIVWKEPRGWFSPNIHCTTNLDMSTWETAKS
ncbi:hypothetical protein [Thomasclavelia sp.]|uniref:hypothetical protein n=1 Tax=Thomasclavelia sp. TaxID=3025757 RepID=UPI0025F34822|nr:hypothetical protein [Thomasclavelia sp.]